MHVSSVKKIAVAVAAAVMAFATNITFLPPAAFAANITAAPQLSILRSWATGRCLDSNTAGRVYTLPCQSGNGYQLWWQGAPFGNPTVVENEATGMCLATNRPGALYTTHCRSANGISANWTMMWDVWQREPSVWVFRHVTTGQCLDSNHAGDAYTHACGSNYQDWKPGF
jgi:serine/threonine-protein kinase